MRTLPITSPFNPRIKHLLALRKPRHRAEAGVVVLEGLRELSRAIDASLKVTEIYWCPAMLPREQVMPLFEAMEGSRGRDIKHLGGRSEQSTSASGTPSSTARDMAERPAERPADGLARSTAGGPRTLWFDLPAALLAKVAYRENPEGIVAIAEAPACVWERVLPAASQGSPAAPAGGSEIKHAPLLVVAVGLDKPGNLGALARTALAAEADGLIIADGQVDPFNPNALRSSTGAVLALPLVEATSEDVRHRLEAAGIVMYPTNAVSLHSLAYTEAPLAGPTALIIGPEDAGLDEAWLNAGPNLHIPMAPSCVDSLNASVAGAIVLFEARRQRLAAWAK